MLNATFREIKAYIKLKENLNKKKKIKKKINKKRYKEKLPLSVTTKVYGYMYISKFPKQVFF